MCRSEYATAPHRSTSPRTTPSWRAWPLSRKPTHPSPSTRWYGCRSPSSRFESRDHPRPAAAPPRYRQTQRRRGLRTQGGFRCDPKQPAWHLLYDRSINYRSVIYFVKAAAQISAGGAQGRATIAQPTVRPGGGSTKQRSAAATSTAARSGRCLPGIWPTALLNEGYKVCGYETRGMVIGQSPV